MKSYQIKKTSVLAMQLKQTVTVNDSLGQIGDWLIVDLDGMISVVPADKFDQDYEINDVKADLEELLEKFEDDRQSLFDQLHHVINNL